MPKQDCLSFEGGTSANVCI